MKKFIMFNVVVLLAVFFFGQSIQACSINAAGSCGGSACPEGKECRKVSDFKCKCVKIKTIDASINTWRIASIEPEPRMPSNINREFKLIIVPEARVIDVSSDRPAFAKVRSFNVESSATGKTILKVLIHGMHAGTLNVPFTIKVDGGAVNFIIRVI